MSGIANIKSDFVAGDLVFTDLSGNSIFEIHADGTTRFATRGSIPIDIIASRTLATNDFDTLANQGGALAKNSDPILERSNTATDKSVRISWASASVKEIQLPPLTWPPSVGAVTATVKILAAMKAGSVNTPVITVGAFEGVGGTNLGGATAALSTTLSVVSVSFTVTGYPGILSLSLTPGAHATASNDVYVYGAWIEFARH